MAHIVLRDGLQGVTEVRQRRAVAHDPVEVHLRALSMALRVLLLVLMGNEPKLPASNVRSSQMWTVPSVGCSIVLGQKANQLHSAPCCA